MKSMNIEDRNKICTCKDTSCCSFCSIMSCDCDENCGLSFNLTHRCEIHNNDGRKFGDYGKAVIINL